MLQMNWPEAVTNLAVIALTGFICWLFNSPWYLFLLLTIFVFRERKGPRNNEG